MSFGLKIKKGDLVIKNGNLATITGSEKLQQDLLKITMTPAGANPLQQWFGSLVSRTLIGNYLSSDIVIAMAKTQLQKAVENLKSLQDLQVASGQKVSPDEQISFIKNIGVIRDPSNPTSLKVIVSVLTRAFGQVSAVFGVGQ